MGHSVQSLYRMLIILVSIVVGLGVSSCKLSDNEVKGVISGGSNSNIVLQTDPTSNGTPLESLVIELTQPVHVFAVERAQDGSYKGQQVVTWSIVGTAANLIIVDGGMAAQLVPVANGVVTVKITANGRSKTFTVNVIDDRPDEFNFVDKTGEALNTLVSSEIIKVTGLNTTVGATISGEGSPEYRVCTDGSSGAACDGSEIQTWTSVTNPSVVSNNTFVQIRATSSTGNSELRTVTIDLGGRVATWSIETLHDLAPDAFDFTDVYNVPLSSVVESDIVQVTGLSIAAPISIDGGGAYEYRVCADGTCSGNPAFTSVPGSIANNQYVQIRLTSGSTTGSSDTATLTVGTSSADWVAATSTGILSISHPDLLLAYDFDAFNGSGGFDDLTGNYPLTNVGTSLTPTAHVNGVSISTGQYLSSPTRSFLLDHEPGGLSLSFRASGSGVVLSNERLQSMYGERFMTVRLYSDGLALQIYSRADTTNYIWIRSPSAPLTGTNHFALSWENGGNCDMYINGTLVHSVPFNTYPDSYPESPGFQIGRWKNSIWVTEHFNGVIDNFRLFNKVFTQGEVTELAAE